LKFLP